MPTHFQLKSIHCLSWNALISILAFCLFCRKPSNQSHIEKYSPILAGIIAHMDTNNNLDLLIKRNPSSWEHTLWLEIINNPSATQIEYAMVVSPKKQDELPEVMVKGTGCDGLKFNALMPFSWLIYRLINQFLRTPCFETYTCKLYQAIITIKIILCSQTSNTINIYT